MKKVEVLFLSLGDILRLDISFEDTYGIIREALIEHGKKSVVMPPKYGIHPSKVQGAHCNAMPAYIPKLEALGIKWVSGFPGNRDKQLPYIMGTLIINDDETGAPLAIMEASWITAMRTATVSGLVAQSCAREDAKVLGIVGAGVQGRFTMRAIVQAMPGLERVRVFDIDRRALRESVEKMGKKVGADIVPEESAQGALLESDIMVTATSFVEKPYVKKEWLRKGDLGILVHHRGWENGAFYLADKLVVDDWGQTKSYGMEDGGFYGDIPECYGELGEILAGLKPGREKTGERIIAITCGLAVLDIAMGKMIYEKAKEKNIGIHLPFMDDNI
jgi:ornithine cyclodeaminase/alanine dehydrogenase